MTIREKTLIAKHSPLFTPTVRLPINLHEEKS